jgi:tRNA threonylcarbamoyladenosine biosynthesis protein TsaB
MRVLGIETGTAAYSVALIHDDKLVAECACSAEGSRGGRLLPMIDEVLQKADLRPDALDLLAVSRGPGSFTGVRVAIATGQGLALGTRVPLVGVSTLEALAWAYSKKEGIVYALLHAGRGEVYTGLFEWQGGRLTRLLPEAVLTPEAVASCASPEGDKEIHVIGDGAARYHDRLVAAFQGRAHFTKEGLNAVPTAAIVARLGVRMVREGGPDATGQVTPVYLRRPEAEINWEKGLVRSPLQRLAKRAAKLSL